PVAEGPECQAGNHQSPRGESRKQPVSSLLLPTFYCRCFVRGPWATGQQWPLQVADRVEPKEMWVPPPRFRPRFQRSFCPRPPQQLTTEGGDGETKPSQGPTHESWPEPQRPGNRPYFQRQRQQHSRPSGDPPHHTGVTPTRRTHRAAVGLSVSFSKCPVPHTAPLTPHFL
uniref:Uncharacterized protein n=1 Tax=Suricata suricatta TaxID=37032 RepID=A0A673T1T6_SURSU